MNGFVDETVVQVASGKGGAGVVSFRHEKFIPRGGPDGGDGGDGGNVVFAVRRNLKTLSHLRGHRNFHGEDGESGKSRKKHGRNGEDVIIPVPPGTLIRDVQTDLVVKDFGAFDEEVWTFLKGGRGGHGNWYYRGPVRRAPRFAQPGGDGERRSLKVELNLIADAGFVGKPNAGKSTLLGVLTRARPRVAAYPFTTLVPHLGVMSVDDAEIILADIPGIIEGASEGAGLGLKFLKHVARSAVLVYLVDVGESDCVRTLGMLRGEVGRHSALLPQKRSIVVGTKLDVEGAEENFAELRRDLGPETVIGISALTGIGIPSLRRHLADLIAGRTPSAASRAGDGGHGEGA